MTTYAVMKIGDKEYRVSPGDVVRVEKLAAAPGATIEIREVCSIANGQDVSVGSPTVAGARVVAEVVEEGRGEKVVSFKKKRRNHYQMTMSDAQGYTVLRIREIAVGGSVSPRISKPERKVQEPQAKKPQQPPASSAAPAPAPIEMPPPVAARDDAPVAPQVATEERVATQPQGAQPGSDAVHPVHAVESPPSAPSSTETPPARVTPRPRAETAAPMPAPDERQPRKRSYGIAALAVAVLLIGAGLLTWSGRQPQGPVEVATVAASPQPAASVPQPAAKAPPRKEAAIKNPAAASAPSAPVQPPE